MSDPLSTASGVLALTLFAFKASTVLYQLVDSFRSNQRIVRELRQELEALNDVLRSLQETAAGTDADLAMLKLPLLQCGKACKEFEEVMVRCTAHSKGSRTSFRDWAKLQYLGDDIAGFKIMLSGYKSTISIALGGANLRTAVITANVLNEYKEMISNTTADLQDRLESIDSRLLNISVQDPGIPDEDTAERRQVQEERNSTQQCLDICNKVLMQLEQAQPNAFIDFSSTSHPPAVTTLGGLTSAQQLTATAFTECREKFTATTTHLERQLEDINNRLKRFSMLTTNISKEQAANQERLQEERNVIKQSLDICADASRQANHQQGNVYEDILMVDEGQQVIISTVGALITARRVTAGSKSLQVFGQMSDESFQLLSRQVGTEKGLERRTEVGPEFVDRYGTGVKLSGRDGKGVGMTPKLNASVGCNTFGDTSNKILLFRDRLFQVVIHTNCSANGRSKRLGIAIAEPFGVATSRVCEPLSRMRLSPHSEFCVFQFVEQTKTHF